MQVIVIANDLNRAFLACFPESIGENAGRDPKQVPFNPLDTCQAGTLGETIEDFLNQIVRIFGRWTFRLLK